MSVAFAANTMGSIEYWSDRGCQQTIVIDSKDGLERNQKTVMQYTASIYSYNLRSNLQPVSRCAPRRNEQLLYCTISPNSTLKKASLSHVRRTYGFRIRIYVPTRIKPAIYALLPTLIANTDSLHRVARARGKACQCKVLQCS
jgi:hypothetical protein